VLPICFEKSRELCGGEAIAQLARHVLERFADVPGNGHLRGQGAAHHLAQSMLKGQSNVAP
jgi:hypothetical protein